MERTVIDESARFAVSLIGEVESDSERDKYPSPTAKP